jgi:hypothetical protein
MKAKRRPMTEYVLGGVTTWICGSCWKIVPEKHECLALGGVEVIIGVEPGEVKLESGTETPPSGV